LTTIPLPIISTVPIDQARPGVQDLADKFIYYLNMNLTLDTDIASDPMKVGPVMMDRLSELEDHVKRVVIHMQTMDNPVTDLSALYVMLIESFADMDPNEFKLPSVMEALDHLVTILTMSTTKVLSTFFERTEFTLRNKGGEFFNG
jgi:hypothetical protein